METGTKVIRKVDARAGVACFGIIESLNGRKATVRWLVPQRQHQSTLAITSLVEVTPELEEDVRTRQKARLEERRARLDAERIYLCQNVNPLARTSNQGHPNPLPLAPGQTKDREGKFCLYCGAPVILRSSVQSPGEGIGQ